MATLEQLLAAIGGPRTSDGAPGSFLPDAEAMADAMRMTAAGNAEGMAEQTAFDASRCELKDADGAALVWALALHCPAPTSIVMARNAIGDHTAAAIAQLLR